jgi:hypothetical protein
VMKGRVIGLLEKFAVVSWFGGQSNQGNWPPSKPSFASPGFLCVARTEGDAAARIIGCRRISRLN